MLSLSRKVGQTIHIGDDIEITISNIHKNHVKVCIKAPDNWPIYRDELYKRIMVEQSTSV
jgi:carbon storage regulator